MSYSKCGVNECNEPAVMRVTISRADVGTSSKDCCLHHLRFASWQIEMFARAAEEAGYVQSDDLPPEMSQEGGIEP